MPLTAEEEVGPYYLDDLLFRSNITESEVGIPVNFIVTVLDASCSPVADAYVDIWHCNSTGYYSGYIGEQHWLKGNFCAAYCLTKRCKQNTHAPTSPQLSECGSHDECC